MSHKKSIPCYIPNGGVHNIVNVPMGQFTRADLKKFCRELIASAQKFETMFVAEVTQRKLLLLNGLAQILDIDLKPKANRRPARVLTAANEKNLKPSATKQGNKEEFNLVQFALSCGLIALCYLIAAHLEYLDTCQ